VRYRFPRIWFIRYYGVSYIGTTFLEPCLNICNHPVSACYFRSCGGDFTRVYVASICSCTILYPPSACPSFAPRTDQLRGSFLRKRYLDEFSTNVSVFRYFRDFVPEAELSMCFAAEFSVVSSDVALFCRHLWMCSTPHRTGIESLATDCWTTHRRVLHGIQFTLIRLVVSPTHVIF
jgi:hypothetical protein